MNKLAVTILIALGLLLLWPSLVRFWDNFQAYEKDYNARQCAVYGYQEDCETPSK